MVLESVAAKQRFGISYWDAAILTAAKQMGCHTVYIFKSMICEVLAGKKPFSPQMIRKLADYFNVDVSVLVANL